MKKGELRATISRGYREMSELTKVKCGGDKCPGMGNKAYRRCDQLHCQMTIDHAYKDWGIRLPTTGTSGLKFVELLEKRLPDIGNGHLTSNSDFHVNILKYKPRYSLYL